jgi:hypothetical protein
MDSDEIIPPGQPKFNCQRVIKRDGSGKLTSFTEKN